MLDVRVEWDKLEKHPIQEHLSPWVSLLNGGILKRTKGQDIRDE